MLNTLESTRRYRFPSRSSVYQVQKARCSLCVCVKSPLREKRARRALLAHFGTRTYSPSAFRLLFLSAVTSKLCVFACFLAFSEILQTDIVLYGARYLLLLTERRASVQECQCIISIFRGDNRKTKAKFSFPRHLSGHRCLSTPP